MIYNQYYPFEIMPLGYDYAALSPDIGEHIMFFHYNEHYVPAVEKLNEMVLETELNQNIPLEELARSENKDLQRTAGNVFTHEMHFRSLTDKKSTPSEYLKKRIASDFGSEENFLKAIKQAAGEVYGSGYVWIAEDSAGRLVPLITKDHELPDIDRYLPVFTLDLWEHGYYIDRQNNRADYVDAALKHINWEEIEKNLRNGG